jgi:hypothetical protein
MIEGLEEKSNWTKAATILRRCYSGQSNMLDLIDERVRFWEAADRAALARGWAPTRHAP